MIEVFDVLIESSARLSLIDPVTTEDVLLSKTYKDKMNAKFHQVQSSTGEPTQIREYVPPSKFDVLDPDFK